MKLNGPFLFILATLMIDAIGIGIVFYMVEGDRPNLIYRHRYRSYRAEREAGDD